MNLWDNKGADMVFNLFCTEMVHVNFCTLWDDEFDWSWLLSYEWFMRCVVTVVAQIPFHKLLQSLLQYLLAAVKGTSPSQGIFTISLLDFRLRYFSRMSIKVGNSVWSTSIPRLKMQSHTWLSSSLHYLCVCPPHQEMQHNQFWQVINGSEIMSQIFVVGSLVYVSMGFPIQNIWSEGKVRHIGSKPWCINSEKLQATDGKTIDVVICIHEQSPLQPFCCCIETCRSISLVQLWE